MAKPETKSKIVSFKAAREAAAAHERREGEDRRQPPSSPSTNQPRSGYTDAWLKAHTDSQKLIQENLRIQKEKAEWEGKFQNLAPSLADNVVFYVTLLIQFLGLILWTALAFIWSAS